MCRSSIRFPDSRPGAWPQGMQRGLLIAGTPATPGRGSRRGLNTAAHLTLLPRALTLNHYRLKVVNLPTQVGCKSPSWKQAQDLATRTRFIAEPLLPTHFAWLTPSLNQGVELAPSPSGHTNDPAVAEALLSLEILSAIPRAEPSTCGTRNAKSAAEAVPPERRSLRTDLGTVNSVSGPPPRHAVDC